MTERSTDPGPTYHSKLSGKVWLIISTPAKFPKVDRKGYSQGKKADQRVDTRYTRAMVWSSPYACAQPYHPGRYQQIMDSCFGHVKGHRHDMAEIASTLL